MQDYGEINLIWAKALIEGLVQSGVHYAVASPGSRSTPLTLAFSRHPKIQLRMLPDERCAAFYALGISKFTKSAVAVIATSGTAPANWYPAVIEASYDRHPLIMLSADRPVQLQNCGANQTIDQTRLFGVHTRAFYSLPAADASPASLRMISNIAARAVDLSLWPLPGPVHINIPLKEPLVPIDITNSLPSTTERAVPQIAYPQLQPATQDITELSHRLSTGNGLIVCGRADYATEFPAALCKLANRLRCPIFADPLSGLRFGDHKRTWVCTHYDAFLRRRGIQDSAQPDWVLRFGGVPTSKTLQAYLGGLLQTAVILVNPLGAWPDPDYNSTAVLHCDSLRLCQALLETGLKARDLGWSQTMLKQERHVQEVFSKMEHKPFEAEVLNHIMHKTPEGSAIFCGNSMIIRDVDSFVSGGQKTLRLHGNRGTSGIDGNVSTALGMAAVSTGPLVALLGDLSLYHDMNGLLATKGLNAIIVVFNNGGGAIFGFLPQAKLPEFQSHWLTPTGLDIARIAHLYDLKHHCVRDSEQFATALDRSLKHNGVDLIEIIINREQSLRRHRKYWDSVEDTHWQKIPEEGSGSPE